LQERPPLKPILLKLSPDMNETELRSTIDICVRQGVDGFILTNTTLHREPDSKWPAEGGVSGQPLRELSLRALNIAVDHLGPKREQLMVSVGGVMSTADVQERLALGADLVQVYAALIYSGPGFFKTCARELQRAHK
jgi:dihydroorotate dehydrogenase